MTQRLHETWHNPTHILTIDEPSASEETDSTFNPEVEEAYNDETETATISTEEEEETATTSTEEEEEEETEQERNTRQFADLAQKLDTKLSRLMTAMERQTTIQQYSARMLEKIVSLLKENLDEQNQIAETIERYM